MSARDEAAGGVGNVDRCKLQPALAHAADAACSYFMTDGFCDPRQCQSCKCWDRASAVMDATGLSARAVGFLFQHRQQIEKSAEEQEAKTWDGTPWWSKPEALARDEANRRSPSPRDQASSATSETAEQLLNAPDGFPCRVNSDGSVSIDEKFVRDLAAKSDVEMERVKACEHIAAGDEGWERLRDLCPSTFAVAALRDASSAMLGALEPFARIADWYDDTSRSDDHTIMQFLGRESFRLTVGMCRAARIARSAGIETEENG
jgi:hypothetical protein